MNEDTREFKSKLNELFKRVRKEGAIARQNFMCCASCASYDLYHKAKNGQPVLFYHRQDTPRITSDQGVFLRFGINKNFEVSPENERLLDACFGSHVARIAEELDLKVDWDGDPYKCIWVELKK